MVADELGDAVRARAYAARVMLTRACGECGAAKASCDARRGEDSICPVARAWAALRLVARVEDPSVL